LPNDGISIARSKAMIAITTNNSINVKACVCLIFSIPNRNRSRVF
jgi:hypothetical protein